MKAASATGVADAATITALLETPEPGDSLFRNTLEHAPVGIAFANRDGSYRHCNVAFCSMLGFSASELAARTIASITAAEDRAATAEGLERLWRGEIPYLDIEKRYVRKDGSTLWVRVSTSRVVGSGGPECTVEFLRDISVRKRIAAELLQHQTLLGIVIAELPVALLACDTDGQVTHHNRLAAELFGIPTAPSGGATTPYPITSQVLRPDGKTPVPREQRPLACALRGEEVSDVEHLLIAPQQGPRTVLSSARRLTGPGGETLGAVVVAQDITERRRAEQELEEVHKQLLLASRQAGMAEVATNVLHNVGNVLNSVNVSASLVAEQIKKSKCAGLARVAALLESQTDLPAFMRGSQGQHLPGYLQELADELESERDASVAELSALRANVEHIKEIVAMQQGHAKRGGVTDTLDMRLLVEDSLRMNHGAFSRHGVTIVRDFAEVPLIQVDKHRVLQILVNVIRNAKYACAEKKGGEKLVTVRVRATAAAIVVAVSDTGIGIPPENLERIFSHGFTTRVDGHGFGLHSSALAAREIGGSLLAESPGPGRGATFTLTLPLAPAEASHGR
ncbi:MAG: PAS domain S-box protein [Sinobacteraceae bacterium]|nr:PAS domain S-box protein [Nevskiaceae bacterium]MBV9317409.1 PAS domain S-box protein [Gammaproteobacteria bacterium]